MVNTSYYATMMMQKLEPRSASLKPTKFGQADRVMVSLRFYTLTAIHSTQVQGSLPL